MRSARGAADIEGDLRPTALSAAGSLKHVLLQSALPGLVVSGVRPRDGSRRVAITFDDGPWPDQTEQILRLLREADARATFFMLGASVRRHPSLAAEVSSAGMLVGNHGQTHRDLRRLGVADTHEEIAGCAGLIEEATGVFPRWFRPPYGKLSVPTLMLLRRLKMRGALWSVDSGDCLRPPARLIADGVLQRVRPGAVVLMHDGGESRETTLAALPFIMEELRRRDFTLVTLDEL